MALSSDSTSSRGTYDVFLSFGGNDIRKGFTGHLFAALCRSGFNTFVDEEKLEHSEASFRGIKDSKLALVLLSNDYAFSNWCLQELVQILKWKKADEVWPIFYDVDPSHVEEIKGSYQLAFTEHEKRFKEEIIKDWKDALQQVSYLKGLDLPRHLDGHEANNIDHIVEEITRRLYPTTLNVAIHPVGIQSRAEEVVSLMSCESEDTRIVGLYGMGGIGKSTIAKEVYNLIHHKFVASCFLANVREVSNSKGVTHLQRQILTEVSGRKHEKIGSIEIGLNLIIQLLSRSKVLLVLDDVYEVDHLHKILGNLDWLFPGSRLIITTRSRDLLNSSESYFQYEVDKLDANDSLSLLSLHAFRQNHPVEDYVDCARQMAHYCWGIPLALEVLGSSLCGQSVAVWNSRLEKLKVIPNDDIQSKLRISYDSLQETEQFIFLDIACFFVGYNKDYIINILDGCNFFPVQGISTLTRKCLLKVDSNDNKLVMHDLLRDMGRGIVRQENAVDPGERSRLWYHEDVNDVLTDKMGTNAVQGLILNKPGLEPTWTSKTFKRMKMLRLLQLNYIGLKGNYEHISNKLRWLCWREFPLESIPSDLCLENVVVLDMQYSNLKQFMELGKSAKNLKFLNLSHSHKLTELANFEGCQSLERLMLKDCALLEKVGDTFGLLSNLVFMNFRNCKSLKNLPQSIGSLSALKNFNMSGCSNLEVVPDSIGRLTHLTFLSFQNCENLWDLPGSIGDLKSLQELNLSRCSKLEVLPESLGFLSSLLSLNLQNCENLKSLPESIGSLESLEKLDMSRCSKLETLPEYIGHLNSLLYWNLQDCINLKYFTTTIIGLRSLEELNMSGCSKLEELPKDLGNLKSLALLNLDETGICSLPESIRNMKKLKSLSLRACPLIFSPEKNSQVISIFPYSIKELDLRYCNIADNVIPDDLSGFSFLKALKLCGNKFTNLPASIGSLPNLHWLYVNACEGLRSIPELQSSLKNLQAKNCLSLERVDLRSVREGLRLELLGSVNLKELEGYYSMETLEVGLAEQLVGSSIGDLVKNFITLCERGIYSIFLPGGEVPAWFSHQNKGNVVSLLVPCIDPGSTIIGVVTYATYAWKDASKFCYTGHHITITNKTKMFTWLYRPCVIFFASDVEQDISWMAYWIFDNHQKETDQLDTGWLFKDETEEGDEVEFSFDLGFGIVAKNSGIHLLCQPTNQGSFLSDELAIIYSATSRHQRRYTNTSPVMLEMNSNGEIEHDNLPSESEEYTEWDNNWGRNLAELKSMNQRVYSRS